MTSGIVLDLALATGIREPLIRRIMEGAPVRYKFYEVDKRNGGTRTIAQPAREVKAVQRALVDVFLSNLPVHPCATGYRKGLSIRDNAIPHAGHRPIIKMDLKDFFPSIRARDWISYCADTKCLTDPDEIALTTTLMFHRSKRGGGLRLAIGAPSSPVLSNILMYEFDKAIQARVSCDHVVYTRYADDLTFSAPRTGHLTGVMRTVARTVRELKYPKLEINAEKTTYVTTKYNRSVTGLTLTNDGTISIGRDKKRLIHSAVHRAASGPTPADELKRLAGMLAFIKSVEPPFLTALERKYGKDVILRIQRAGANSHNP